MKRIIYLMIFVISVSLANADIIDIMYTASPEVTMETFGTPELGFYTGICGDGVCDSAVEQSLCPLDCRITTTTAEAPTTSGGATTSQIVDCPVGFEKIDGICTKTVTEIKEPEPLGGLMGFIKNNSTFLMIVLVFVLLISYFGGRWRGGKYHAGKDEDKDEGGLILDARPRREEEI